MQGWQAGDWRSPQRGKYGLRLRNVRASSVIFSYLPPVDKIQMFENRLAKVWRHLQKQAKRQGITCFRLYDRDLPEFPLIIDWYEGRVQVAEYRAQHKLDEAAHAQWLAGCLQVVQRVLQVGEEAVYVKERKRKEHRQDQYGKAGAREEFFTVGEGGLLFRVNLSDYLDTGLFPDHRITRAMVRDLSAGKRVLNLFCYTGAFSVYAAAGGAAEVVSVDLSNTYLSWAKANMELNGLYDGAKHHFIKADVKQYLDELRAGAFDIVIMDPPTFSNSKMMKDILDIQRDHVALLNKVLRCVAAGGVVFFSTNYRRFALDAAAIRAASIKDITRQTTPFDFEGKLQRWCFRLEK
jgi:23S rRNA (cytosine1962-C5)-methyltransferase